jgi:hypothetical protein
MPYGRGGRGCPLDQLSAGQMGQLRVDLGMLRGPDRAERLLEPAGQVISASRTLGEQAQQAVPQ